MNIKIYIKYLPCPAVSCVRASQLPLHSTLYRKLATISYQWLKIAGYCALSSTQISSLMLGERHHYYVLFLKQLGRLHEPMYPFSPFSVNTPSTYTALMWSSLFLSFFSFCNRPGKVFIFHSNQPTQALMFILYALVILRKGYPYPFLSL